MAGKTLRKQYAVVAYIEGLVEMMYAQHYKGKPVYREIRARLRRDLKTLVDVLRAENTMSARDYQTVKAGVETLREAHVKDRRFSSMQAVSFCLAIVCEQMDTVTNAKKKAAFGRLYERLREFDYYFDPGREYDSGEGGEMAETFTEVAER